MQQQEQPHNVPGAVKESPIAPIPASTTINGLADTPPNNESEKEDTPDDNSNIFMRAPGSGVDVKAAEAEFEALNRQLSGISHASRRLSKTQSRQSRHDVSFAGRDLEKGQSSGSSSSGEPFDLANTLRGDHAAAMESGIRPKHMGVIWEGLSVFGNGGVTNFVKTFPDAFIDFFNVFETAKNIFGLGTKGAKVKILDNFRGLAKPGEMVLVLGRPGSGCTTFLKVIANQRYGYTKVDGEVLYGPLDAETFGSLYRGEAVYNQEDDVHHPTLTVGQTLGFALDTKTPGKRPHGVSKAEFKEKVITTLLRMFNIEHTKNTIVGNPFIRGISGGERKRVSIAEMMVTSGTVCAWDNSTRGLDSSTALDYAKSLRILTNLYKTTTFVSLYQASENIYRQFDKVIVIDAGRQVYHGPASEARAYFEGLGFKERPRQTTPDFLTGCTDEFEREYASGHSAENAPSSPETLAQAFNNSKFTKILHEEMAEYRKSMAEDQQIHENFKAAVTDSKRGGASKKSVYSIPFYLQIWVLMQRQYLIKWQDKFSLVVSWVTSIVIALVLGSTWLNIPQTSAGAFTRGGLFFISVLFNALQAFSELGNTMLGRPIVNKQKAYTFYRPSALWIANIIVDLAFSAAKILVFCIIVYFMCGLALDAGAFFTFYIVIIVAYLAMTLLFRILGCVSVDFDYAIKIAATLITLFVITSGYIVQYQSEKVWLRWMYWVNAMGLGFSMLMENEFSRLHLTCTDESLVPSGPGYNSIANQVCTLQGSVSGTNKVSGSSYIEKGFSYSPSDLWRNFGIIIAIIVASLIGNVVLGEFVNFGAGGNAAKFFQKPNKGRKELNAALLAKRNSRRASKNEAETAEINITSKAILTWEGLKYDVPTPSGQLRLLDNVFGYVKPGELTALMGASGAGKTTLLDVLAARKNIGVITGDILIDGLQPGSGFQRGTSYAEQLDVHEPTQTVREALRFSAELRQPYDVAQSNKYAYVEEVISLLEMEDIADAIIGDPSSGLAVEQRKRVTIGVELAAKPELLLFLDEPTSGLDSQSAFNIVRFLKKLAGAGQAILCTIHQPNAALFENFDRLLLLQHGGQTVYFGDIGNDACILRDYFHQHGADCPPDANPAEFMLDAIGAGQAPRIGDSDWADIWVSSPELASVKERISQMKSERLAEVGGHVKEEDKEFAAPLLHQLKTVQKRTNLSFWRSPNYGFTRLFNHLIVAILTGLAYLNLDDSRSSLQYRTFIVFQVTVLPALILAQVEPKYAISRMIFYREASSKMYGQFAFASSLVVAEMPYSILCAVCFFLPIYYMPGFSHASSRAGYQFLMVLITEIFSVTLGQTVAALTPTPLFSALLNPFIMLTFALFCGVAIPKRQMPKFWRSWLYELDPFTRLVSGMVVTELHERPVKCNPSELQHFTAPAGQNCGEYMDNFFQRGGLGYIVSNATSACEYCAYKVGDQFYEGLGLDFANRWRDLGIFIAFIGGNLIILFLSSRYLNFNRR